MSDTRSLVFNVHHCCDKLAKPNSHFKISRVLHDDHLIVNYIYILISLYKLPSPFHCLFVVKLSSIEEISQRIIGDSELNRKIEKQELLSALLVAMSTNASSNLQV